MDGLKRLHPQLKDLSEQTETGHYLAIVPNGANTPVRLSDYKVRDGIFYGLDAFQAPVLIVDALKVIIYHDTLVHLVSTEALIREAHADEHAATEFRKVLHPDECGGKPAPVEGERVFVVAPDGTTEIVPKAPAPLKTGQYL